MGSLGTLSKPLQAQPGSSAGVWGPPGADVSSIIASAANQPEVLVDYRILYEVHGSFDPWDTDNASLVVIAIDPFPTDRGRQFLRLSVRVSALAVPDENVQGDGARRNDVVRIEAFEPSSREQPVYVWATNEARRSLASLQPGASREKPSTAHTSKPERTHMLRVKSGWETANNGYGYASWEVSAAEKARGIGDSFTVAVLVRRPSGARFRLALAVNGDAGTFCRKALEFLPSDLSEERPWVTSGTFPSSAAGGKVPRGVCAGDLHHALLDNALEVLEEIGLVDPAFPAAHLAVYARESGTVARIEKQLQSLAIFMKDKITREMARGSGASAGWHQDMISVIRDFKWMVELHREAEEMLGAPPRKWLRGRFPREIK